MLITDSDSYSAIEMRHLRALVAVGRTSSFSRAANELGYAQSAVSQQIAALERIVGVALVERPGGPRPVSLTPQGQVLVRHAERMLARLAVARGDLLALAAGEAGHAAHRHVPVGRRPAAAGGGAAVPGRPAGRRDPPARGPERGGAARGRPGGRARPRVRAHPRPRSAVRVARAGARPVGAARAPRLRAGRAPAGAARGARRAADDRVADLDADRRTSSRGWPASGSTSTSCSAPTTT